MWTVTPRDEVGVIAKPEDLNETNWLWKSCSSKVRRGFTRQFKNAWRYQNNACSSSENEGATRAKGAEEEIEDTDGTKQEEDTDVSMNAELMDYESEMNANEVLRILSDFENEDERLRRVLEYEHQHLSLSLWRTIHIGDVSLRIHQNERHGAVSEELGAVDRHMRWFYCILIGINTSLFIRMSRGESPDAGWRFEISKMWHLRSRHKSERPKCHGRETVIWYYCICFIIISLCFLDRLLLFFVTVGISMIFWFNSCM